jgi:hypothetical protein
MAPPSSSSMFTELNSGRLLSISTVGCRRRVRCSASSSSTGRPMISRPSSRPVTGSVRSSGASLAAADSLSYTTMSRAAAVEPASTPISRRR